MNLSSNELNMPYAAWMIRSREAFWMCTPSRVKRRLKCFVGVFVLMY
jgi:hypothetical protein